VGFQCSSGRALDFAVESYVFSVQRHPETGVAGPAVHPPAGGTSTAGI